MVWCLACSTVDRSAVRICLVPEHFDFPPVVHDWVNKGLGYCLAVSVYTGHIKDPVPFIEKGRASCPGDGFPPSFIYQLLIIIITGLNKLYDSICSRPEDGFRCRQGGKPPLKLKPVPFSYGGRIVPISNPNEKKMDLKAKR